MNKILSALALSLVATGGCVSAPAQHAAEPFEDPPLAVTPFNEKGLGVAWDKSGSNRLAYDIKGPDGYYDVHLASPDGSGDTCLTCDHPGLPNRHIGAAFWHPQGRYLIFVAEKAKHPGGSFEAIPGFGGFSDIWIMTTDGKRVTQLTDTPNDSDHGVLPAHFSPDGRRIAWTERIRGPNFLSPSRAFAFWVLKVADFIESPAGPRIANVRTFQPGPEAFYEGYGFSPDGKRLIFCSSMNQPSVWTQQIFTIDADTGGDLRQLTESGYNEHATYTPDGSHIVWMSGRDNTNTGTDWWIMRADGGNKRRLTYFNRPGHPHYAGGAVWAGFPSFNAAGSRFAGGIVKSLFSQEGRIVIVELPAL